MRVGAAEQVVPLEDLVEDDAVHEAAEADPEQDPGARGRVTASTASSSGARRLRAVCAVTMGRDSRPPLR
jgi:hypothetical protein